MFFMAQKGVDRKLPEFRRIVGDRAQRAGFQALGPVREQRALGAKQRIDPKSAARNLNCIARAD
jgi:hypothetical protein